MAVRASRWFNDSVALERGPLVYSLRIGADWRKLTQRHEEPGARAGEGLGSPSDHAVELRAGASIPRRRRPAVR